MSEEKDKYIVYISIEHQWGEDDCHTEEDIAVAEFDTESDASGFVGTVQQLESLLAAKDEEIKRLKDIIISVGGCSDCPIDKKECDYEGICGICEVGKAILDYEDKDIKHQVENQRLKKESRTKITEFVHNLYECRYEHDKLICIIERANHELKLAAPQKGQDNE